MLASVLAFALTPQGVRAEHPTSPMTQAICHAASGPKANFADMVGPGSWNCANSDWRADQPVAWLRFDASSWAEAGAPNFFVSRTARFEAITFAAFDRDGTMRTARYAEAEGKVLPAGPFFQLRLPEITPETQMVVVRIDRPHSIPLLTEARLTQLAGQSIWTQLDMMLLALVVGMLILPLMFDISFFVVLRERFVAIHAVMVASMISYVLFAGGLITVLVELPVRVNAVMGPLCWAIGCGLSALFLIDFLEKEALSRTMRKLTMWTGFWTIFVPGFFALQLHATQAFDDTFYFLTFIPAMVIITAALCQALWRGSHDARFLAVAWSPIILSSLERLLRGLGVYAGPSQLDQMLYLAVGIEVVVISLAIAVRFLSIRRERDAAVTEASILAQLSTHDPLTGLMNRRAVEERFAKLREDGFDTFAVIDLDHFKDVNDRFGHQAGDRALIACGRAIRGSDQRDTVSVRLGGEEFVVLLRGPRALERAEALRQAIPMRIASEVEGLDRSVTASMGLIELPRASDQLMSFNDLYKRADQLLYNAKASGRNRTCYERLTVFRDPPSARPITGAAA